MCIHMKWHFWEFHLAKYLGNLWARIWFSFLLHALNEQQQQPKVPSCYLDCFVCYFFHQLLNAHDSETKNKKSENNNSTF